MRTVFGTGTYSCQFDAQVGSLDHAFLTQSLKGRGVGGKKWHNSDEPGVLNDNEEFKAAAQMAHLPSPASFSMARPIAAATTTP